MFEVGNEMKTFKFLARLLTIFGLMMIFAVSGWGLTLDTDNFDSDNDGWGGTGESYDGTNDRLLINRDQTATKTYNFGVGYANAVVTVTMTTTEIGEWEDSDVTEITANGSSVYNSNVAGLISFNATLNGSGQLSLVVTPNTNSNAEDLAIDTISIDYIPPGPPVISDTSRSIAENSAGGTNVGATITATNSPTSFSITGGTGQSLFDINAAGQITVHAGAALDYETTSSYTLLVKASNSVGDSNIATITVNITDVVAENLHEGSRPFTIRNPANTRNIFGNYFVGGNTNMCVTDSTNNFNGTCTANTSYQNNSYYTKYIDVDSNTSTFNSSNFTLNIPSGSKVIWAGLYWQGYIHNSDQANDFRETMTLSGQTVSGSGKGLNLSVNSFDAEKVFFQTPQDRALNINNYQAVVAEQLDFDNLGYAGFKNVTSLVSQMSPNGIYTVANIQSHRGKETDHGNFAGWSLVVIYENSTEDLNNVSVFDGYETVDSSYNQDITVSGFYTPTSGTVNSKLTVFSMEGEGSTGDSLRLNGNLLPITGLNTDTGTTDNVFNGSITNVPTRNPSLTNNDGLDLDTFNTSSIISNGQSSATIRMRTTGDRYTPSMLVFSTELYQPEVCYYEEVYKGGTRLENGAQVNKGDALNVKVYVTNKANETAEKVKIYRTFDTLLPYTENTTHLDNNNPIYGGTYTMVNQTDNVDADTFDYNATDKKFQIRIGTGASSTSGGNLVTNQGAAFDYNITMNSEQNTSISYEVAYTNTAINFDYIGQIGKCVDFNNTFWGYSAPVIPSDADIIDTFTTEANYNNNSSKVIKTKIASQSSITITAVHLDSANQASVYTASDADWKFSVIPFWSDGACSSEQQVLNSSGEQVVIDIPVGSTAATGSIEVKNSAQKDTRFKIVVVDPATLSVPGQQCIENSSISGNFARIAQCANSEVQYTTAFGSNAWNRCGLSGGKPCLPQNHGAADPNEPSYNPLYAGDLGCYICTFDLSPSCSTDNFAIRPDTYTSTISPSGTQVAGHDFSLTTVAKGYNNTSLTGYDGDANVTAQTQISTCSVPDGNLTVGGVTPAVIHFNGVDTNVSNSVKFGDIGVFDMNTTDFTWTAVDSVKNPVECIVDSHTNIADANGKIGCLTRSTINPTVIPDHFDINGTLANGSNGFTYLLNFENNVSVDQNRSALLNVNATAKAETNTITSNYSSACYAKNGTSTLTLTLNPAPPSGDLNKLLWYDDINNSINGNVLLTAPLTLTHPSGRFTNGVGNLRYRLNFDRNITKVVNPFLTTINNMSVIDTDNVDGNNSIDNNATFVFGRTHASRQRYEGNTGTANIYYESFCFGASCNKTLLPNGVNSNRTDDVRWYWNQNHNTTNDGTVGTVTQKGGAGTVSATAPTAANPAQTTLNYNGSKGYPYRTTMENNASNWLIQNEYNPNATRNEFQVEFDLTGDWTGEHETNTTTKSHSGATTNRRLMW